MGDGISMELRRKMRLHTFFIRYAVFVMIGAVVILSAVLLLFSAGIQAGWIVPANYAEGMLAERAEQIRSAEKVTEDLIPETCRYGVYDQEGNYLYGTLKEEERKEIWNVYEKGEREKDGSYFRAFARAGEVCIVKYRMVSEYTNAFLQKYLPSADWTLIGAAVLLLFLLMFYLARRFGTIISRELSALEKITEKISRQELDFGKESSKVKEIDAVLRSMDQMKEALKASLDRQWKMEQVRREQVAALAHDIKTPLTILRGSAELTLESGELEEAKEYALEICEETKEIEAYLQILQEMLRAETEKKVRTCSTDLGKFTAKVKKQAEALAKTRKMEVNVREVPQNGMKDLVIQMDETLLYRAWMNVIANAVEYGRQGGVILLTIRKTADAIELLTEDDGQGFSEEDLVRGTEQFYRGDKSRGKGGHYGMGLAIAERFSEQQGGRLLLENSSEMKGAKVTIVLPGRSEEEKEQGKN